MPLTNAQHQAKHRAKQANQRKAMHNALTAIVAAVDGKTGPIATRVRVLAEGALGERK